MDKSSFVCRIRRIWEPPGSFALACENNTDWSHFRYCHRKTILDFRLVEKTERQEIFFYKARVLYPLPFWVGYLVFRRYGEAPGSFQAIYQNVRTGRQVFLDSVVTESDGKVQITSDYIYELPPIWRFFRRLFYWIFTSRMSRLANEDNVMLSQRHVQGAWSNESVGPNKPKHFDMFEAYKYQFSAKSEPEYVDRS